MRFILRHPVAFLLGIIEFRGNVTSGFYDDGSLEAYDWGREFAHRITLRRFEP